MMRLLHLAFLGLSEHYLIMFTQSRKRENIPCYTYTPNKDFPRTMPQGQGQR